VEERRRHINATDVHRHVLIVPGDCSDSNYGGRSVIYRIRSPRIEKTCDYRLIFSFDQIREIIQAEKPDIIECADPYQLAWVILDLSKKMKIPAVAFYHSHFPEACVGFARRMSDSVATSVEKYSQLYVNQLYNRFRRTLVPSTDLADILTNWGVRNVVPVNLGVDTTIFKPGPRNEERRAILGVDPDQILLLYVGRLSGDKNLMALARAFLILDDAAPRRYHLHLIGEGRLSAALADFSRGRPNVSMQPFVANSRELAENYLAADLFVHPGMSETFGLVTLEAQACGLPVIGIRGTFMDRLAFNGVSYWADSGSPEAMADAIGSVSTSPLRAMGLIAAQTAHQQFGWSAVFTRLFELYQNVVAN
jgi:alpha-1,6-mannosyltransferase